MRILALQLKRIGDVILTTPALRALRLLWPDSHVTLALMEGTSCLLAAIPAVQSGIIFGAGRRWRPWQQVLTGGWDLCLDFTGNDRSALAAALSRAKMRVAFQSLRKNRWRSSAYNTWSPSNVRETHTARHYLDLVSAAAGKQLSAENLSPDLKLPDRAAEFHGLADYALLHPGSARPEKYWEASRWAAVAAHLAEKHGLQTVITCGPDLHEREHVAAISAKSPANTKTLHPRDVLSLAALVAGARIVISCDTAVVHLASAFRVPQIALFGPTNPYHWRPLHDRALVLSATQPDAPIADFQPRMKEAPMELISTTAVIRATDCLLALPR